MFDVHEQVPADQRSAHESLQRIVRVMREAANAVASLSLELADVPREARLRIACTLVADAARRAALIMGPGDPDGEEFASMAAHLAPSRPLRELAPGTPRAPAHRLRIVS